MKKLRLISFVIMIVAKFRHLLVIMTTKNMQTKISHTENSGQAVDTPVKKCVVLMNNKEIRYEKS